MKIIFFSEEESLISGKQKSSPNFKYSWAKSEFEQQDHAIGSFVEFLQPYKRKIQTFYHFKFQTCQPCISFPPLQGVKKKIDPLIVRLAALLCGRLK